MIQKEKSTKWITLKIGENLKKEAEERAKKEGYSLSSYIKQLIRKDVEN